MDDDEKPTTSNRELPRSVSVVSQSTPYACCCCEGKCPLPKDFLESQSEEERDPPFIFNSQSMARDSKDTVTMKIASPLCHCANCPLRNFCECIRSRENFIIQQVFTICQDTQGEFNENFDFIGSIGVAKS